jgi:hypothetical protein
MDHDFIKTRIAPCGLDCGKCYAFVDGDIKNLSNRLKASLGNFDIYAERFAELINGDIFRKYPDFKEHLAYFASADCKGCRNERCKIFKDCKVRDCFEKNGVDFCFQCPDFPCDNTGFDEHLQKRSIDINMRMKEIGVEKFYEETRNKPRY